MDVRHAEKFDAQAFRDGIINRRTTILQKPLIVQVKRRGDRIPVDHVQ